MKFALRIFIVAIIVTSSVSTTFAQNVDGNRGFLNVFRRESLQCGKGWKLTGLVWGDRPLSACMYKPKKKNVFGGEF